MGAQQEKKKNFRYKKEKVEKDEKSIKKTFSRKEIDVTTWFHNILLLWLFRLLFSFPKAIMMRQHIVRDNHITHTISRPVLM